MKTTNAQTDGATPRPISKLLEACKEAHKIQSTGKDSAGNSFNSIGKLNQAAWLGERAISLIAEIERLQKFENEYEALNACVTDLELSLESLEALSEQENHGDELCDGEGGWHTRFCEENGCIQWRIERARKSISTLQKLREGK